VERRPARRHRHAVKPSLETAGREIPVQPGHEGRGRIERIDGIAARVGEKDAGIAVVPYRFGRPRISFTIGVQESEALPSDEGARVVLEELKEVGELSPSEPGFEARRERLDLAVSGILRQGSRDNLQTKLSHGPRLCPGDS
jgi:hypothetical protein